MPSFLKSLFKSNRPSTHPRPRSPSTVSPIEYSPDPTSNLEALAEALRSQLEQGGHDRRSGASIGDLMAGLRGDEGEGTIQQLLQILGRLREERDRRRIDPFPDPAASHAGSSQRVEREETDKQRARGSDLINRNDPWSLAFRACEAALGAAKQLGSVETIKVAQPALVERLIALLDAQWGELQDMRPYVKGRQLPEIVTLARVYEQIERDIQKLSGSSNATSEDTLLSLVQVLEEGPDFLIDVALIEAIIWQAEVIDPSFGGEIKQILEKAVNEQSDLTRFRRAAESIVAVTSALPKEVLDDELAKDAYRAIGILAKQLQIRVAASRQPSLQNSSSVLSVPPTRSTPSPSLLSVPGRPTSTTPSPLGATSASTSPLPSPASSGTSSPGPSLSGDFERLNVSDLQARYGTGTTTPAPSLGPTPSATTSANPTPQRSAVPSPPDSPASEQSIWEYRGNLLTRSALELVLRQEALAMADSSGQYAGEVSWDELRNAWIPKWAEKLKIGDLAEGEVPNTNPADFKVKKRDAWGNKIGWYGGRMYYEEDPVFDLR